MNYSFQNFYSDLRKNTIKNPEDEEFVELYIPGQTSSFKVEYQTFNGLYLKYIKSRMNSSETPLTESDNNLQVRMAKNVIYLDGDYVFNSKITSDEDKVDIATHIMNKHVQMWKRLLSSENIEPAHIFKFIPETFNKNKGGHHVFIYLKQTVTKAFRNDLVGKLRELVIEDNEFQNYLRKNVIVKGDSTFSVDANEQDWINELFDRSPIVSLQGITLFAKKGLTKEERERNAPEHRNYMLVSTEGFNVDIEVCNFVGIIGYDKHSTTENIHTTVISGLGGSELFSKIMQNSEEMDLIQEDYLKESFDLYENGDVLKEAMYEFDSNDASNSDSNPLYKSFGPCVYQTLRFVKSLTYLSPNHKLFEIMKDHNRRLFEFIKPLLKFLYINIIIKNNFDMTEEEKKSLCILTTKALLPVITRTVSKEEAETTHRHTFFSCFASVKTILEKYVVNKLPSKQLRTWYKYCRLAKKEKNLLNDKRELAFTKRQTNEDGEEIEEEDKIYMNDIRIIRKKIQMFYIEWVQCVEEKILAFITNEVEPFKEQKVVTTDTPDCRIGVDYTKFITRTGDQDNKFYFKTVSQWIKMFIFITYINCESTENTLSKIVCAFLRYYIWHNAAVKVNNHSIYIYNIRQTRQLMEFPYNQWIADDNGINIKDWVKNFYMNYIEPELQKTRKHDLEEYLKLFNKAEFSVNEQEQRKLKAFDSISAGVNALYRSVMESFSAGLGCPDKPTFMSITAEPIFPCRNGILYWKPDGSYEFKTDNKKIYTDGFTNVMYVGEKYNESSEEYEAIERMWNQTFPIEEDRIYMKRMISSILSGKTTKDQFLILYGTGGDGKTTFCNAIQCMLGINSSPRINTWGEGNKQETVINPKGLAASMKTETVLTTNTHGHDEGGRIELSGARFCTIQEPDKGLSGDKINCAVVKELTSGSTVNGRHIHGCSETFIPNCLMILQTNSIPRLTEDTDATRRRFAFYPMQGKFTTNVNKDSHKNFKYRYDANPIFAENTSSNGKYWSALFYSLLPYCSELIKNKWTIISNIPRPESVKATTENAFTNASGLMGFLNQNIKPEEGRCISLRWLIEYTIKKNSECYANKAGKRILESRTESERRQEIVMHVQTKFPCIYKLRKEYYVSAECKAVQKGVIKDIRLGSEAKAYDTNEDLIGVYFGDFAISNAADSKLPLKDDLFIVGYKYEEEKEEEEEDNNEVEL